MTNTIGSIYVKHNIKQNLIEDNVLNDTIDKCEEYVFATINSHYYKNEIKKSNSSKTKKKKSRPTITPKQIQDYAQQMFDSAKMNIFIVSPTKIKLNFEKLKKML